MIASGTAVILRLGDVSFDTSSAGATAVGAATTAEHTALINFAKGLDTGLPGDEDVDGVTDGEKRPSAHG